MEFDTSSILGVDPKNVDARNHHLDRITLGLWSRQSLVPYYEWYALFNRLNISLLTNSQLQQ